MPQSTKTVALFGGSFNPPHWGHHQVLDYLKGLSQFDEIWMVPTYDHPFEKNLLSYKHRQNLSQLTTKDLGADVKVSLIEGELKNHPSYMIETIRGLKKKFPAYNFKIVIGSDCKDQLSKWKDIYQLKKEASFFFIPRPGFEESPFMNISSTEIRQLIKEGKPYTKYVVPEVADYIESNGLYK